MLGKEKCKALKEIRRKIAEENDIEYVVSECTYQGECKGTCPRCEEELEYLERELEKRKKLGRAAIIVGLAAGVYGGLTAVKEYVESQLETIVTPGAVNPQTLNDSGDE